MPPSPVCNLTVNCLAGKEVDVWNVAGCSSPDTKEFPYCNNNITTVVCGNHASVTSTATVNMQSWCWRGGPVLGWGCSTSWSPAWMATAANLT